MQEEKKTITVKETLARIATILNSISKKQYIVNCFDCVRKPPDSLVVLLSFSVESLIKTLLLVLYICDSQLQIKIH